MTLTIELTDEQAAKVERLAEKKGKSAAEAVVELIDRQGSQEESLVEEIRRLTKDISLPSDSDDKKEYHEYISRKHA